MADVPRYRFGPLEKRGVLAGLSGPQVGIVLTTALAVVTALRSFSPSIGAFMAAGLSVLGALVAFVPVGGRTAAEWLPLIVTWLVDSISGRRRFLSNAPTLGATIWVEDQPRFPRTLKDVGLLSHLIPGTADRIGVVKDRRQGTYTGILAVKGKSFALLDHSEKSRRLSAWAGILSGLAREKGVVHRIQWVERTVPDSGDAIGQYLRDNIDVPLNSPLARSYLEVVDSANPVTQEHEVFVALQIHGGRSNRSIKAAGGGDFGACEVLRRELTSLSASLLATDVVVEGALTPRLVAHAMRTAFDPECRHQLASIAAKDVARRGTSFANGAPLSAEENWSSYRTDGAWHSTYWIAEWPRVDANADFLAPLLLRTEATRTVSLTMNPISPLKAIRSVESARTSSAADEELRQRAGFVSTSRRRKEQDSLADHERDLSEGHAFYRFSGFITVTAGTEDELAVACGEIEEAAGRCFLDIRKLSGQQAMSFTYSLPLCRGLK